METPREPEGRPEAEIVARHRGLVGRTLFISALTLLSRILGFLRETLTAFVFGDGSAISDAFFTAWRVPNLFRRLFGEGALSTSLQTALTEADAEDADRGRELFLCTILWTFGILCGVTALAMVAIAWMPDRMPGTGWPWLGADPAPVRDLAVRLLPYVVLVCIAALCGGALQVRGHYGAPNLAPVVMNLTWIAALLWVGSRFDWAASAEGAREEVVQRQWSMARLLAVGVLLGGVVQLAIHAPPLLKHGLLRGPRSSNRRSARRDAWHVLRTSLPLALGAAVYQINVMVDGLMAEGLLTDGGPTALYYANRIQQFPMALVALAAVSAVFPALKAHGHLGDRRAVRDLHDRSQFGVLFLALPAAVGLLVLTRPIASVLFEHGNYGPEGVDRIAAALRMLAIALIPAGAAGLTGRTYFALADFRTPVMTSVAMLMLNTALNFVLVAWAGLDVEGLALATALTTWGNLVLLFLGLRRRLDLPSASLEAGTVLARIGRVGLATSVSGATALATSSVGPAGLLGVALAASVGAVSYFLAAQLLGVPEWKEFRQRLARRGGRGFRALSRSRRNRLRHAFDLGRGMRVR